MRKFRIVPDICECESFVEFAEKISLCDRDLLVTESFVYETFMKKLDLQCHFVFQNEFGSGEPTDVMVDAIKKKIEGIEYDRVIGVGGGTVIDISKVLALKPFGCMQEIFDDPSKIVREKELVIVTTTCGTGSEVTRSAIIASIEKKTKVRMAYDQFFANSAVLIPELISTLPYRFFAFSSIDALIHAVESFLSPIATPYTELFATKAIELILEAYKRLAEEGKEVLNEVERDILLASNYAGISFGNAGCGAVHCLAYPLSGRYHLAHGESNYQFFCGVLEKYFDKEPNGKIAVLYDIISSKLGCKTEQSLPELAELLNKIWPVKRLSEYGMKKEEIDEFAEEVYRELQVPLATSYVPLSLEELKEINRNLY